jgi:hypothetical protein
MHIGWAGSNQRNYRRLLSYYESRGKHVVLQIMPLFCPEPIRHHFEVEIEQAVKRHYEASSSKLFVHIFSNNGSWNYASLCKNGKIPMSHKIVIDSAPSFWYDRVATASQIDSISAVFTSIMMKRPVYDVFPLTNILKVVITRLARVHRFMVDHQGRFHFMTDFVVLNTYFRDHSPVVPTLFISSSGDKLVPLKDIASFRDSLQQRGVPVMSVDFGNDIGHTSAFFKRTSEYTKLIDSFFFDLKSDDN